jgi:hypothetical protein
MSFWTGTPGRTEQISRLRPDQDPLSRQLVNAGMNKGAGGAFGDAADYYRGLLSNESEDFNAFANPELRRFREQTIPGIAMDFANQGAGALSSSGFRNATVNAGTDLSERLGAIRAQLRQSGAQGLANIGQQGLGNFTENVQYAPQGGLVDTIGPAIGAAAGSFFGPAGTAVGGALGNMASNWISGKNKQQVQNIYNPQTGVRAPGSFSADAGLSYMRR